MANPSSVFRIDALMVPVFFLLAATGAGIHISAGKGAHAEWHAWSVAHVVLCAVFLVLVYCHVRQHLGWFRTLLKGRTKGRGVTAALTALMAAETVSGIVLLVFVDGGGSGWGRFHWVAGILLAVVGTGHFLKRFPRMKRGLRGRAGERGAL